jgi:nucleotide-binding universal stress UspA family protein
MTNVLIAVDDTESSVTAAQTARRLFGDDADYTVISVSESEPVYWGDDPLGSGVAYPLAVPPVGSGMGMAAMALTVREPDRAPDADLPTPVESAEQTARGVAAQAGIQEARPIGDSGDAAKAILEAAETYGADVIVVGSHDRSWLDRLFNSSVTAEVVKKSDTPVLVAR